MFLVKLYFFLLVCFNCLGIMPSFGIYELISTFDGKASYKFMFHR